MNTNQSLALRHAANVLLTHADASDKMHSYAVVHKHKFGDTPYLLKFGDDPTEHDVKNCTELIYEPDRGESFTASRISNEEICGIPSDCQQFLQDQHRDAYQLNRHTSSVPADSIDVRMNIANAASQTLACLHQCHLQEATFIALQHAVAMVYQQAHEQLNCCTVFTTNHPVENATC